MNILFKFIKFILSTFILYSVFNYLSNSHYDWSYPVCENTYNSISQKNRVWWMLGYAIFMSFLFLFFKGFKKKLIAISIGQAPVIGLFIVNKISMIINYLGNLFNENLTTIPLLDLKVKFGIQCLFAIASIFYCIIMIAYHNSKNSYSYDDDLDDYP
jgi:hypothetical protein